MAWRGVLFDFHQTLVMPAVQAWWQQACKIVGDPDATSEDVLPVLRTVWARAGHRHQQAKWDLDGRLHREVFEQVLIDESPCSPALATALYDTMPQHWILTPGAPELVRTLREAAYRIGVVSNIGRDIRPRLSQLGLLTDLDAVVLSVEEGLAKPDPRLFTLAAGRLGLATHECVFVGDDPQADGGAAAAGMTSIVIPRVHHVPQLQVAAALLTGL